MTISEEALALVQGLVAERDAALAAPLEEVSSIEGWWMRTAPGYLVRAKILDLEARQAAEEFWAITGNEDFMGAITAFSLNEQEAAEVEALIAQGKVRLLTDSWSGLAAQLKREALGL